MTDVLTPEQLMAARALLRWTRQRLSDESKVPMRTIESFEQGRSMALLMTTEHKLRRALERSGVKLLDETETDGPGVRLKKS